MTLRRLLLLLIFGLNNIFVAAQIPGRNSAVSDKESEAAKYERYYEIALENALAEYYPNGSFLVDVQAVVDQVLVASGYQIVDKMPPLEIENLPGLPVIPPGLKATNTSKDSIKVSGFNSRFQLSSLVIKVLVDKSYSNSDIEFIEELASMTTNADRFRGDNVSVERKTFPKSRHLIEPSNSADTVYIEPNSKTVEQSKLKKMFLGIDWANPTHLLYVIIALAIILGITLLWILVAKSRYKKHSNIENIANEVIKQEYTDIVEKPKDELREFKQDKQTKFEEEKMFIINRCISRPKVVADLLESWIEKDEEEGLVKAVRTLFSTDPKLIDVLQPHLTELSHEKLLYGLTNIESIPVKEKADEVSSFKKRLLALKHTQVKAESETHLFEFLNQLTDRQLLHLLRGESEDMIAILIAQLSGERASFVLQKIEENKRISIVLKMGKIANIPISIYKKVASHFSSKALSVSDMKYVAADGVESILNTIDNLPISEQQSFVNSIAEKDLSLAKKIRKFFIAFENLTEIDDDILLEALEEIDTDELINALSNAPEPVRDKILSARPKREKERILSELNVKKDIRTADIEESRRKILQKIRKLIKKRGV